MSDRYLIGKHPDFFKSFFDLAIDQGFNTECHQVITDDDYILNLFRIKDPRTPKGAPVVFLQHGLFGSAENWVMNDKKSIAFILASKGYDVWLGNHRGTKYSRNHMKLDPDTDQDYWKFSFVEMGEHDMPASINYVRTLTGVSKVSYIGHSQGTT